MEYDNTKVLACMGNPKDACLYFDNVIPLNLAYVIPWKNNGDMEVHEVLQRLLPEILLDNKNQLGLSSLTISYLETFTNLFPTVIGIEVGFEEEMERARKYLPKLIQQQNEMIAMLKTPVQAIFGANSINSSDTVINEDPALILTGLKLVDTSNIKWCDLLEIKKDKEALSKLRRLRTFIYQNYKDKPKAFIQDDLLNRIEVYETTARHLGLKTTDSTLKIIFNSGSLIANTAATITTALSGSPVTIPIALGIGSAFMLGNVGLELRSHKRELYKFKQENPVTYLADIKELG